MSSDPGVHESRHPTLKQYVGIAIFLFVVTIVEFVIILPVEFRGQGWTIAPLAILSAIKFAAVIFFYMHLKFDNRLLTWVFLGGLALGFAVVLALVGLFTAWTPSQRSFAGEHATPCTFDHEYVCVEYRPKPTPVPAPTPEGGPAPAAAPAEPAPAATGALVATGQQIFLTGQGQGSATACFTCHTIEGLSGATGLLGPDLTNIGTDAANRQPGVSAEDYLRQSITEPEAFVAEGVERAVPGLMLTALTAGLTDEDVDALVAFLLEQK